MTPSIMVENERKIDIVDENAEYRIASQKAKKDKLVKGIDGWISKLIAFFCPTKAPTRRM